ncbi:MAG: hypothetical protein ABIJ21_05105 [Nanoarchaeota archaeon]
MTLTDIVKKIGYNASKEAAHIVAPLAAVSSMAGKGGAGILDNIAAIYHVPVQVYHVAKAYITNEGIRTFTFERIGELADIVGNAAKNLVERPAETIGVAAGVYALIRSTPQILKYIGKRKKHKHAAPYGVTG